MGFEVDEISAEQLYKYMRDGLSDYDVIKDIDQLLLARVNSEQAKEFIRKATDVAKTH